MALWDLMRARIRRELGSRSHVLPPWLFDLEKVEPYRAVEMVHALGDGDNVHIGVRLPAGHEMTLVEWDEALDLVCDSADDNYEWFGGYMKEEEFRRTSFGRDLDAFVMILGWAGILERVGASSEPDRWIPTRERLSGGTLHLTASGRWWLKSGRPGQTG
jgi:hypothetical protein